MRVRETLIANLLLLGLLVLARWLWTQIGGPPPDGMFGYFNWAAYLVASILAFSVVGSALAGLWFLLERWWRADAREREASMLRADACFFYIDGTGGKGPWQLAKIIVVPALAQINVEFRKLQEPVPQDRQGAMRAIVGEATERLKLEMAPQQWVGALPQALASLSEHALELRGPSEGYHWYDPPQYPNSKST